LIEAYSVGRQLVRQAVGNLTAVQFDATPVPGQWSTRPVVCHIADCELVCAGRMVRFIEEKRKALGR
jgi:hypothetical protein